MSTAPRIFLVFGSSWLEVDTSLAERRGGLRAIAREAEREWNLQPNLYEFRHTSGKVNSPETLQRALESSSEGVCKLDVDEHVEGRMMRTMHTEMKLLEDRVMAKMEAMMVDVRKDADWNSSRLAGSIAPMVQCLATEQIELRNKLCGSIAPMVQCLATEQIELRNKVSEVTQQVITVAAETECTSVKDAEALEQELQQECALQTACDLDLSSTISVEELKEEVCQLSQKQKAEADSSKPIKSAPQQNVAAIPKPSYSLAYSTKALPVAPTWGYVQPGDEVAPFAQSIIARQLRYSKSSFATRSCPLLPPLQ